MGGRPAGLRFTERMHGVLACGSADDRFDADGGLGWLPFRVTLDARIPDVAEFLRSDRHPIDLPQGVVESGHFGQCRVTGGQVNLMVAGKTESQRIMRYRICFTTADGVELTLLGFKDVQGGRLRMWYDTTRVFAEVHRGCLASEDERDDHPLVAVGVLEIPALTFLLQLTTFRVTGGRGFRGIAAYVRFMLFFIRSLIRPYVVGLVLRAGDDVGQVRARPDVDALVARPNPLTETA